MGGGGGVNNGDRLTKSKDLATNDVVDDINTKQAGAELCQAQH